MNVLAIVLYIGLSALPTQEEHLSCPPCECFKEANVVADCERKIGSTFPKFNTNISKVVDTLLLGLNNLSNLERSQFDAFVSLRHLDISFNNISRLESETFAGLPNVTYLNISNCKLDMIDCHAFSHLRSLEILDVSENPELGQDSLEQITFGIRNTEIKKLYVNHIVHHMNVCVIIYKRLLQNLQNTSLEELHLNDNRIELFSDGALLLLPNTLSKIFLKENRFTLGPYLKDSASLSGLKEIDLSGKRGSRDMPVINHTNIKIDRDIKQICSPYGACQMDLKTLNLQYLRYYSAGSNDVPHVTYTLPPNLYRLKCSHYQLSYNISKITFKENSLRHLDLSTNLLSSWTGPVYGLENLTYLDLSNNIAFHISCNFLERFYALETLNISFNNLGMDLVNDTGERFKNLNNLTLLDLSNNFIVRLNPQVFSGLRSLETLHLSKNNIHYLFINVTQMTRLHTITCSKNQVSWIPRFLINDLEELAKDHPVMVDLSENPIACTCENLHLLRWFRYPRYQLEFGNFSNYFCIDNDGNKIYFKDDLGLEDIIDNLSMKCHYYYVIAQCVFAVFILTISGILSAVAYRYRWKLRYWYYAIRLRYSRSTEPCAHGSFEFDVFVSFADEDRDFVVGDLVEHLEDQAGLRLNIHQRDFTPGRSIAQNIVNAVQTSRRTLVILSMDFLASSWCRYELEMANMEESTTKRDLILVIMYGSIASEQLPSEVALHMMKDSYIEYPQYGETDVFWETLVDALKV